METKPLIIVEQVLESPCAFCSSKLTASPNLSVRASLKPSVAASSATCCTSWQIPILYVFASSALTPVTSMLPTAVAARIVDTSFFFIKRSLLVKFIYLKT